MKKNNDKKENKEAKNNLRGKDGRSQIALAMTGHAMTDLYASFIIGLIPVLALKFNLSLFLVSLMTSVTGISNSLTQPVFGYFSDRYNARYFLIAGPLFSAVLISLIPVIPNYPVILLLLFLGNLSIAATHPPTAAIGGRYGGKRKGLSNSLISLSGTIGYAFGSLFIIAIIDKLGNAYAPIAMIPGIIMSFILYKFIKDPNPSLATTRTDDFFSRLKKVKKLKIVQLSMIFSASFARDILWISLITFMPVYFTEKGVVLLNMGYILTAFNLIGGFGGVLAGLLSDKIRYRALVIPASFFISIPLVFSIFRTEEILSVALFIIAGFFVIATLPLCIRLSQDIFPANISLASSLVMGLSIGSASIAIILIGRLADTIGIEKTINYILILPAIVMVLLCFYPLVGKKTNNAKKIGK